MICPEELEDKIVEGVDPNTSLKSLPIDIQDIICCRMGEEFSVYCDDLVLAQTIINLAQELSPKMTIIAFARMIDSNKSSFRTVLLDLKIGSQLAEKYGMTVLDFHENALCKGDKFGIEWRYKQ